MSWATVKLISAEKVKGIARFLKGVQDADIVPGIHDAQHALQEMLGETLYARVETANPVSDPTLGSAGMRTLYDNHIVFFLSWKAKECSMEDLWGAADRNGVLQRSGEGYNPVDGRTLSVLQSRPRSRSENFATEMIRYLKNLDTTDPIRIAYDTSVKDEPRTEVLKHTGRISTRLSPWQYPEGRPNRYRDGY